MNQVQRIIIKQTGNIIEHSIKVDAGVFGEKIYQMRFSVCGDFENCDALHISLSEATSVPIHTAAYMKDRTFVDDPISQNIQKSLTKKDWELLELADKNIRSVMAAEIKAKNRVINFPMESEIENSGTLVPYQDIFPINDYPMDVLQIEVPEGAILLDDSYCLRKNCHCLDTYLEFQLLVKNTLRNANAARLRIGYKTGKFERIETLANEDYSCLDLWEKFKQKYPDIENKLANRHNHLKQLYEDFRKRKLITSKAINIKKSIGRNAPCPCGSGKKYKRCCDL